MSTNPFLDRDNEIQRLKNYLSRKEERHLKISKALSDLCVDLSWKNKQLLVNKAFFLSKDAIVRDIQQG
jgi:hypothetical protein